MKFDQSEMKQAFEDLKDLRLSVHDKQRIRSRIVDYMKAHPAYDEFPQEEGSPVIISHSDKGWYAFIAEPFVKVLIIVLTLTGGTLVASEKALPGDPLYAFKTHVTEPLRGAVVFTNKAKAEWEYELASRRLEEVIALADSLSITQEQYAKLVADFKQHAENSRDIEGTIKVAAVSPKVSIKKAPTIAPASAALPDQSVGITSTSELQSRFRDWLALQKASILKSDKEVTPEQQIIISAIEDELAVLPVEEENTDIEETLGEGEFQFDKNQLAALEKMGIDSSLLKELTEEQQTCVLEALGDERAAEILAGELPTALDIVTIESCVVDVLSETDVETELSSKTPAEISQE